MHKESQVAAQWWANHLRNPEDVRHDAGDLKVNAVTNWARDTDSRNSEFDAERVDVFETELAQLVEQMIEERPKWDYQAPYMMSGNSVIRCDYHADPLLQEAADEAGLEISSMTTFPVKTTMWVDPAEVRVSAGYGADVNTIWEYGEHGAAIRESVSEWEWTVEHPETEMKYDYEPWVFPTDEGYIIRAYGHYSAENFGPEHRDFHIRNEDIGEEGLDTVLARVENRIEQWRRESVEENGDE